MSFFQILKKLISSMPGGTRHGLNASDSQMVKMKWMEIEQLLKLGRPSNYKTAILEADKLFDHVLKLYGYRGQTMGDRMKSIPRDRFDRDFFDEMWQAHKIRNEMVHNMNYEVQHFEAGDVIRKFGRVLKELGAL